MTYNGKCLQLDIFGSSHEAQLGMTLRGLPAGFRPDLEALQRFLNRRAPGRALWESRRREPDCPLFTGGLTDGVTDGGPLTAVFANTDVRSQDYDDCIPRPGHADYTAWIKYGTIPAGGGVFSGRMTAPLCLAGGLCIQLLAREGVQIFSRIASVGRLSDRGELTASTAEKAFPVVDDAAGREMIENIMLTKSQGDSLGGVIECAVFGLPAGLGGALFDGLEGRISSLMFAIPAVKGIEFGAGFAAAALKGSENNDPFLVQDGKITTVTNHCGGILGGISSGMPLRFRVAVKPTPSIAKVQQSVNLKNMTPTVLSVAGRHDPCIVPRAVPCVEAAAALALYDARAELK